jgi:hypothetical protein
MNLTTVSDGLICACYSHNACRHGLNTMFYSTGGGQIFIIKTPKGRYPRYNIALSGLKLSSLGVHICYCHLLQTQIVNLKTYPCVVTCSMISKLSNRKGIWTNFHNIIFQITQPFWGSLVIQKLKKFPASFLKGDSHHSMYDHWTPS